MYNFRNDYSEGAHPHILQKLIETNLIQQSGYGEDGYSLEAKDLLKQRIENSEAKIFFVSGGTQANLLVIASLLRIHEAVICARTGHIYASETGAIEALGHRIITVETEDGKLSPTHIDKALQGRGMRPHVVEPRLVYISNSTELGTIYTKKELSDLSVYCHNQSLYLFMDGARLGNALTSNQNDLTLQDISKLTDVFYIGGTKNGALLGEAIIFNKPQLAANFDYILKQKGALLAKGRLLGIQFLELFRDDLYFSLAKHANDMARRMSDIIKSEGFWFLTETTTNQLFPILPKKVVGALSLKYQFYEWKEIDDDNVAVRLITSWITDEDHVNEFVEDFSTIVADNKL